jgi:predicted DNA-binding protein
MPFSLRLDPETEALLRQLTSQTGRSKAQVVREAVAQYAADASEAVPAGGSTFDRLKAYAGIVQTGGADYSIDTHQKYRRSLQQKHRAQRPR